jgi:catechol 2,3-dioxygenase-like lactoylglutathione lyase family enzyme
MADENKQLPARGEIFLDHVGWYVPDLDQAASIFGRLGFPLTPYSLHGDRDPETGEVIPQGSANRLAVLERGYLEFLTDVADTDTPVSAHLRDEMDRHIGVHLTAFSVANADAEADRLGAEGFSLQPVVHLRRSIEGADGTEVEAGFTVLRAAFGSIPEGRMQTLTHHTPEHVWQDRYIGRDNGIIGLSEVVFAVTDPADSAARIGKFTARQVAAMDPGVAVALDRGRLTFMEPGQARQYLGTDSLPAAPAAVAVRLVSHDLSRTRDFLRAQGVPLAIDAPDRLVIGPDEALGCALIVTAGWE